MHSENELTLSAEVQSIAAATDFINARLKRCGCSAKILMQIDIAVDELLGNIARYAYAPESGKVTLRLAVNEATSEAVITFIDSGRPYNPLKKEDPDITLGASEREVGGLGIFIARKFMDEMSYEYKDGQNILTARKKRISGD